MNRSMLSGLALVLLLTVILAACGGDKKNGDATATSSPAPSQTNATASPAPAGDDYAKKYPGGYNFDKMKNEEHELEVLLIPGFLTDSLWDTFFKGFQEDHPKWKIKRDLNPKATDISQARLLSGDPAPFYLSAGAGLSPQQAIKQGLLSPLDDLFKSKAYDSDKTVEQVMMESFRNHTVVNGKPYTFIYRYATNGILYNAKMFEQHGWKVPATWEEFLALCETIKSAGITPLMLSGKISQYPADMFIAPTLATLGGGQAYIDKMHRFEEGAFKNDVMKQALERFTSLLAKGYFKKDVAGLDHTQSQMEFLQGRSAMLLMGSWFEGEMKDSIPAGFEYKLFPVPARASASDPIYLPITALGFTLTKSKQSQEAKEFVRYFFSDKFMKQYVEGFGEALVTNTDALAKVDASKLSVGAKSIAEQMKRPDVKQVNWATPTPEGDFFYGSPVYNVLHTGLQGLIAGNATIDKIMDDMEKAAKVERDKKK